jgi:hypothetical protein
MVCLYVVARSHAWQASCRPAYGGGRTRQCDVVNIFGATSRPDERHSGVPASYRQSDLGLCRTRDAVGHSLNNVPIVFFQANGRSMGCIRTFVVSACVSVCKRIGFPGQGIQLKKASALILNQSRLKQLFGVNIEVWLQMLGFWANFGGFPVTGGGAATPWMGIFQVGLAVGSKNRAFLAIFRILVARRHCSRLGLML